MKPYKITAHVTTEYTLEVHGEDEDAVTEQTKDMDKVQIENAGEFVTTVMVAVNDVELLNPEDYEEPEPKVVDMELLKASEVKEEEEDEDEGGH